MRDGWVGLVFVAGLIGAALVLCEWQDRRRKARKVDSELVGLLLAAEWERTHHRDHAVRCDWCNRPDVWGTGRVCDREPCQQAEATYRARRATA